MPFFDRHWQVRRVGAVLAALAAILFPVRYLQIAATWDARRGWDMTPDLIFAVGAALALALAAVLLARSVAPARERQEYRRAVIEGRETPPKEPPEYAQPGEPPETIVLRISIWDRLIGCIALPIVVLGPPIAVAFVAVCCWGFLDPARFAMFGSSNQRLLIYVFGACMLPFGTLLFVEAAVPLFSRSPRYIADADRLTYTPRWGKARSILWSHARLLELTTYWDWGERSREPRYRLYGDDTVIVIDSSSGRYRDRSRLLSRIQRRTGLDVINLGKPWPPESPAYAIARFVTRMLGKRLDFPEE